ncbi:dienelactone hydrolase family protein [Candidatus Fermentibacteria bacterium]|nr:dienelactone hydrolase family protein [Candidatus Fermentibacteria bacterium]
MVLRSSPVRAALRALFAAALLLTGAHAQSSVTIRYADKDAQLEGYLALPEQGAEPVPGILIVHQWLGVTDHEREVADRLAQEGYAAFACDIYGADDMPDGRAEAAQSSGKYKGDVALYRRRLQRGLEVLRDRAEVDATRLAVIGYCFGGTGALELARSGADVKAAVSFHGGLATPDPEDARQIKGTVLVCHGGNDSAVPDEELMGFIQEMRNAEVDWYLMILGNAVHGFTHRHDPQRYDAKAEARSWEAMRDLFTEVLQN